MRPVISLGTKTAPAPSAWRALAHLIEELIGQRVRKTHASVGGAYSAV
jgi:hypothetical protein